MRTMILVILAALTAVCGADKLDKVYLPPVSAKTAGGNARSLQAPLIRTFDQGSDGLPTGGYTNDHLGVIVDAVNPDTRASGAEQTGLGGPRFSYGSTNSKVGDAAFRESVSKTDDIVSSRIAPGFESFVTTGEDKTGQANFRIAPGFGNAVTSSGEGSLTKDKISNTLKFNNDVGLDKYSYGYETDNGIVVGENGVDAHGARTQGGYAFKGDDGKVYEVTYTADEGGYKPQGSHLPTPPPIPHSILVSLDKNAKEEAAGIVDDGSYDAQKYNEEGEHSDSNNGNKYNNRRPSIEDKDANASGSFGTQNEHEPSSFASQGSSNYRPGSQYGTSAVSSSGTGQFGQTGQVSNTQGGYKPFGAPGPQFSQSGFNQIKTENRFGTGFQSSFNKGSNVQGSYGKAPFGTPGFGSAFSSAVSSGSGSATAFAQSGSGPESEYKSQQPFGSRFQGSDAVNPTAPSIAIASASATDSPFNTQSQYDGVPQSQASATVEPGQASSFASAQNLPENSKTSSFGQSLSGNSGVPSAFPSSATASASVTPQSSTFGNQQQHQIQQSSRPGQLISGSGTGSGYNGFQAQTSKPGQHTQGSVSGFNQFGTSFNTPTTTLNVKPTSGFSSFNQKPTNVPNTELVTPYEPTEKPSKPSSAFGSSSFNTQTSNQFGSGQLPSRFPSQSAIGTTPKPQTSQLGSSNFQSTFSQGTSGQYNNNKFSSSQGNPTDATYSSSTKKPSYQEQGKDSSYYYKHPDKPFITPNRPQGTTLTQFGSQISGNSQPNIPFNNVAQGIKYPNTPALVSPTLASQTGQYQPTSLFNGITQAAVSSFPSDSSTQFGSKPSLFSQSSTQTGTSLLDKKPFVQSQSKPSSTYSQSSVHSTESSIQENKGTIYEYNKPAETFPSSISEQNKPTQVTTGSVIGSQFSQGLSQFGSQSKPLGTFQQTQLSQSSYGSQSTGSFGQKPTTSTFGQKPFGSSQISNNFQQSQFGAPTGPQFSQKPGGSFSQTSQKPFGSSFSTTQNQFSTSQFGQKPTSTVTGFGSLTGSNYGQKPQTQGTGFTSTVSESQTQIGSSQTSEQSQFGSTSGPTFGQKPQSGSSFSISTVSPLSNQKPFGSSQNSGSNYEQSQFSSTASQLGQLPSGGSQTIVPTIQQNQATLTGAQSGSKPFGSSQTTTSFQQTGFGLSTGSLFGQKPQNNQGSSVTTSTVSNGQTAQTSQFGQKPFGSSTQQSQFGSSYGSQFGAKPINQGSTFSTISNSQTSQTTQFGQKPIVSSQTGSTFQQSQFGTSGATFVQKPQSTGSSFSIGTLPQGQKPFGSVQTGGSNQFSSTTGSQVGQSVPSNAQTTFQQNQFISQFGQKPSGSSYTGSYGQKPQSIFQQSQFGSSTQQTQFGTTSGSTFSQKPSTGGSSFGIGSLSQGQSTQTTQKPFGGSQTGSSFEQSQFGTLSTASNGQAVPTTQFGQKPFGSTQTSSTFQQSHLGTSGSSFGQKPLTPGSSASISTVTTQADKKPFGTSQTGGSSFQQSQFGSLPSSQFSQKPSGVQTTFGQKPFGSSQTTFQQNQFGTSTGSNFGQKPQITQGPTSTTISKEQTIQNTQFGQNTFGSQSTGFGSQQNQFSSQIGQKPHTSFGTGFGSSGGQTTQTSQFGQKPFGSQSTGSTFQQNQVGSSVSQFGQKPSQGTHQSTGTVFTTQFPVTSSKPQFGSQTQKPFGGIQTTQESGFQQTQFSPSGSYFGQKPLDNKVQNTGSVFGTSSQTSQSQSGTQNQKPFQQNQYGQKPTSSGNAFVSTTGTSSQFGVQPFGSQPNKGSSFPISSQVQKPFGSSQTQQSQFTQTSSQFSQSSQGSQTSYGSQAQKPFGSSSLTQTGANQPLKPFGSVGTGFQNLRTYGNSYSYQKPVNSFSSQFGAQTSRPSVDQKPQPSQASSFASTSKPAFGSQTFKPFGVGSTQSPNYQSTVGSAQFGAQSTEEPEYVSTPRPQFTGLPVSSTTPQSSFQPTPTLPTLSHFGGQSVKPFGTSSQGNNFGQAQSTASSTGFGGQSAQSTAQTSQGSKFGQSFGSQRPNFQANSGAFGGKPELSGSAQSSVGSQQAGQTLTGYGEQFGGPRDPPRFDDKTGYHY